MPAKMELHTHLLRLVFDSKVLESYFPKLYQDLPVDTP
jgi:hypothetical protein